MQSIFRILSVPFAICVFGFFSASSAEIGSQSVQTLQGEKVIIGSGGAMPQVVFVLATRCPISNAYNDRMMALATDSVFANKIRFVGLNPNETENNEEVRHHATENNITFPIYRDPTYNIIEAWKIKVTPEVFLFDKGGKLVYHGRIDDNQDLKKIKSNDLRTAIERLLAGKSVLVSETHPFGCSIKRLTHSK